ALYQATLRQVSKPLPLSPPPAPDSEEDAGSDALGDPPLTGRDAELLWFGALAERARRGPGRALLLVAGSGGGTRRTRRGFAARWRADGGRVLAGCCYEIQRTVPLSLWTALLAGVSPEERDRLLGRDAATRRRLGALLTEPGAAIIDPEA